MDGHNTIIEISWWVFAPSNFKRPLYEIVWIFLLIVREMPKFTEELMKHNASFHVLGDMGKIPKKARLKLEEAVQTTKNNTRLRVCINVMYDGRMDVLQAIRNLSKEDIDITNLSDSDLDSLISKRLYTADCKPVDLLFIPWSAKWIRIRDFFLWQIRNAHVHWIDTLLPDVTMGELDFAISRAGNSILTDWWRKT